MKTTQRIQADQVQVGDLACFSDSMNPSDTFHRVTEVQVTEPWEPIPGRSKACTIKLVMGKRRAMHLPSDSMVTVKR